MENSEAMSGLDDIKRNMRSCNDLLIFLVMSDFMGLSWDTVFGGNLIILKQGSLRFLRYINYENSIAKSDDIKRHMRNLNNLLICWTLIIMVSRGFMGLLQDMVFVGNLIR